ncbi:MAG: hypothetical protein ACYCOU_12720 [Sulfobacillus sp.]
MTVYILATGTAIKNQWLRRLCGESAPMNMFKLGGQVFKIRREDGDGADPRHWLSDISYKAVLMFTEPGREFEVFARRQQLTAPVVIALGNLSRAGFREETQAFRRQLREMEIRDDLITVAATDDPIYPLYELANRVLGIYDLPGDPNQPSTADAQPLKIQVHKTQKLRLNQRSGSGRFWRQPVLPQEMPPMVKGLYRPAAPPPSPTQVSSYEDLYECTRGQNFWDTEGESEREGHWAPIDQQSFDGEGSSSDPRNQNRPARPRSLGYR